MQFEPTGVVPACLMPFTASGEMDVACYRLHLSDLSEIDGVTGITINGHAAEMHTLSREEQHVATVEEIGDRAPVICGIYAESTRNAEQLAKQAAADGAHALLIFPHEGDPVSARAL